MSEEKTMLEKICNALGWQGGTIHQVIQRVEELRINEREMIELSELEFLRSDSILRGSHFEWMDKHSERHSQLCARMNSIKQAHSHEHLPAPAVCEWECIQLGSINTAYLPVAKDKLHEQNYVDAYLFRDFLLCPYCGKPIKVVERKEMDNG